MLTEISLLRPLRQTLIEEETRVHFIAVTWTPGEGRGREREEGTVLGQELEVGLQGLADRDEDRGTIRGPKVGHDHRLRPENQREDTEEGTILERVGLCPRLALNR